MIQPSHEIVHDAMHALDLGPIAPLMEDDDITDILINGPHEVFIERSGRMQKLPLTFPDEKAVRALAERIVAQAGRTLDDQRPFVDARLPNGARVNVVAPPLAVDGTTISIRKFSYRMIDLDMMVRQENISSMIGEFLKIAGKCRMNILISGGTGSGKTTLLNAIARHIELDERVVTIEDAAELRLFRPNIVRLETKLPVQGSFGNEEVTIRDLVRNALRMRPDRIIVGEVRGPEAFDMMQAMNSGHEGSLTTIHANHPRDALSKLENMVSMANLNLPLRAIRNQIASALHLVIQTSRMRDGVRRITGISEIVGMEGDIITMQDLFHFVPEGDSPKGIKGSFRWTGIMPRTLRRITYYGEHEHLGRALGVKLPNL